ncbi:MAG: DUF4197 domain-containing protein [Betaproteobacteria bacterium]|jgi:hypothetical protein
MKRRLLVLCTPLLASTLVARATAADASISIAGIKEALALGTENAVKNLGRENGYFANQAVKILLPSGMQKLADVARKAGFQPQVDELILTMNRAAEKAAPLAATHFANAIRGMGIQDVRAILQGGDTGATAFFERKTRDPLFAAFKPSVSKTVEQAGASRAYKSLMERVERLPLLGRQKFDLEEHVTNKALDGLFYMVGEEEKKIRRNPLARTTSLLKTVFGN